MNSSRFVDGAFDVLLDVQDVDGPQKLKLKLLCKRVLFEGVRSDKPFFVRDQISLRYREEMWPRHFEVETQTGHISCTDVILAEEEDA